jgi:SAM-dependent methyltransferase
MRTDQFELHDRIEETHWWFCARRAIVLSLLRECVPPGERVLEIGCGTGGNLKDFSREYRVSGCDVSAEAVQRARKRCPDLDIRSIRELPDCADFFQDAKAFLLLDVLEHVEADRAFLAQGAALMPRGSTLIATVPANPALWSAHDVSFGHLRRYDMKTFSDLWRNLPLHCRLASYYNHRLYPLVRLVRRISRRRGAATGLAGTDFTEMSAPLNRLLLRIFARESRRLVGALRGARRPYRSGASLIAVLEKGEVEPSPT